LIISLIREHGVPGAAMALGRQGKLLYARGFGFADVGKRESVKPDSLFRIASISKTITAAATLRLIEQGKIKLDTRAFEFLDLKPHLEPGATVDERLKSITVQHLLRHTAGFDREESIDPMFRPGLVAKTLSVASPPNPEQIIRFMMGRPLDFTPGKRFAYSNFGYSVLGRIIEKASGLKYDAFVRQEIFKPLGISRPRLGRTLPEGRAPGEVVYYDAKERVKAAVVGPMMGKPVPAPYGSFYLEAMDSLAGWIATPVDLVRFAASFNDPARSKILSEKSILAAFSRPPGEVGLDAEGKPKAKYYGFGWDVQPIDDTGKVNAWHAGALAGSSSTLVRRADGIDFAVLFNSQMGLDGAKLPKEVDAKIHDAIEKIKTWPDIDLNDSFP